MPDEPGELNPEKVLFERRKFVRIDGKFVVSYRNISAGQPKVDVTQTKNISLGGILFTTDRKFEPGAVLKLKIRIPEEAHYIDIKVGVVDSKERVRNMLYETRVRFIGITDEDRNAIGKLVDYYLKNKREQS